MSFSSLRHHREAVLKEPPEEIDPARASRILQLLSTPSEDQLERGVNHILNQYKRDNTRARREVSEISASV